MGAPLAAWRVDAREFLAGLVERDGAALLRQINADLPRVRCHVRGPRGRRRARTAAEFVAVVCDGADEATRGGALGRRSLAVALLPFATQTTMAAPLERLHALAPAAAAVVDGRGPLEVEAAALGGAWSVEARKVMRVLPAGGAPAAAVEMRVRWASDAPRSVGLLLWPTSA